MKNLATTASQLGETLLRRHRQVINRGYYTVARRYEFYVQVARITSEALFSRRERKINIFELTCNVFFYYIDM